ncbi:MAG: T9SS type A sorting domain-containing protein [Ignavibacteria bacterium]|nr:T9SS type A sorting domain-containing protein [Ignavibacteria bacterium]
MTTTPAGTGYYPDGCGVVAGGSVVLYRYTNHTATDTVAAIGNIQTGYVVATVFQDPRYFLGGFGEVLKATVGWVRANGGVITGVNNGSSVSLNPNDYSLAQNFPNPFNPETSIRFSIPSRELVTLKIYSVLGKEVATLVNEIRNAGAHEVKFNASSLPSGTYFYRIESGNFVGTKKMMLVK